MYNLLNVSLENMENPTLDIEGDLPPADEVVEEVVNEEDSTLAVTTDLEGENELEADSRALGLVVDEVDSLERIHNFLNHSVANNKPASSLTCALLQNHLSSISRRTGLSFPKASTESFDTPEGSLTYLSDALEDSRSAFKKIMDWIKEKIMAFLEFLNKFIGSATFAYKRLHKQAEGLLAKVNELDKNNAVVTGDSKVIENFGSRVNLMISDNQLVDTSKLDDVMKLSATANRWVGNERLLNAFKDGAGLIGRISENVVSMGDALAASKKREAWTKDYTDKMFDALAGSIKEIGWVYVETPEDENKFSSPKNLSGNRYTLTMNLDTFTSKIETTEIKDNPKLEVGILSLDEMRKALTSVISGLDEATRSYSKNISSRWNKYLSGGVTIGTVASDLGAAETRKAQELAKINVMYFRAYGDIARITGKQHLELTRSVMKWVSMSASRYGVAKSE